MHKVSMEFRVCECCGGSDLELVWQNSSVVTRANGEWRFPVSIVVCRVCGFCFSSPAPTKESLEKYYSNGYSGFKGIGLPYSIEARLALLKKYAAPNGVFAEIGGDDPGEFHKACSKLFQKQIAIDISSDINSEIRSVKDLAADSIDVIAHYDVLEHIAEVKEFLSNCFRALKFGGVMICEVPNVRLYGRSLTMMECEHLNHFSPNTLTKIAYSVGFELIEIGHQCSRNFGFLAIFRKKTQSIDEKYNHKLEYLEAMACIEGGKVQIEKMNGDIKKLREVMNSLGSAGEKITLWGVTDILRQFLRGWNPPSTLKIVDSDGRRASDLQTEGISVSQPIKTINHISHSALIVLFAPRYKMEIVEWIEVQAQKKITPDNFLVLGVGPSGESLN